MCGIYAGRRAGEEVADPLEEALLMMRLAGGRLGELFPAGGGESGEHGGQLRAVVGRHLMQDLPDRRPSAIHHTVDQLPARTHLADEGQETRAVGAGGGNGA